MCFLEESSPGGLEEEAGCSPVREATRRRTRALGAAGTGRLCSLPFVPALATGLTRRHCAPLRPARRRGGPVALGGRQEGRVLSLNLIKWGGQQDLVLLFSISLERIFENLYFPKTVHSTSV